MNLDIKHNTAENKFYCVVNGKECVMEYGWLDDGKMNFYHTYVPTDLRGRGIAQAIQENAAEYALGKGYQVVPTCSGAAGFFARYKKCQKIVSK